MNIQKFRMNRARFPRGELERYRGKWIAFSSDGRRIIASNESLDALEDRLSDLREDPQRVIFEYLPGAEDDLILGGGESL